MADNLAPAWAILINDSTWLPASVVSLVESVNVEASSDGADELVITAKAYDPGGTPGARWAIVGTTLLAPGNFATVYAGYTDGEEGGATVALQRFRLVAQDVDYGAGQIPTVTVRGYSGLARAAEFTEARAWEGPIADSDIVTELAAELGYELEIDATASRTKGRVKPRGESALTFLRKLAVANGYGPPLVRWDPDKGADVLTFKAQVLDTSTALTFTLDPVEAGADLASGNLLSFRASLDLHGVPTSILVAGFDKSTHAPVVVELQIGPEGQDPVILEGEDAATFKVKGAGEFQAVALEGSADPRDKLTESMALPSTVETTEDAIAWAKRWVALRFQAFMTGDATILGNPTVWAGQVHRFQGLADVHVGYWEVLTARHAFEGGGYTVALDLARVLEDQSEPEEA